MRSAETLLTNKEKTKRTPRAARTLDRLRGVQPPSRLMLAHYPGDKNAGARYVPHLDNEPVDPGADDGAPGLRARDRAVTAILYLNPDWEEAHGGCLRVRLEDEKVEVDVAPAWGRVVLFDSRRITHEVRPARHGRWALTAWINDGPGVARSVGGAFVAARSVVTAVPNERRADGPRPRSSRVTKRKQACVWLCVS